MNARSTSHRNMALNNYIGGYANVSPRSPSLNGMTLTFSFKEKPLSTPEAQVKVTWLLHVM
jgi:hypothetical protein